MTAPTTAAATGQRRTFLARTVAVLRIVGINFLIFAVSAEIVCLVLVHRRNWPASRPNYHVNYNEFWIDSNPVFGVWHRPNGSYIHKGGCFEVEYTTNSYGARDVERSLHSSKPRTIVLGDSFMEGMGLPDDERLSNVLERDTGREYLNFGTGGDFGPLQYALLYKSMAAAFDHDTVLVGVLPDNDFHDMSLAYWDAHGQGNRYRPYYADDLSVVYAGHFQPNPGESFWDHVEAYLRAYLASYHVGQYLYASRFWHNRSPYSGYNEWNDIDLARLKKAIEDIKSTADAHGAKVDVFLIPSPPDFRRMDQSGENRLGPVMEQWGQHVGISVKDLLPEMDARAKDGSYQSYFLKCNGHWSAHGAATAAEILEPWLAKNK
jgi:hypothetical protein